MPEPTLDSVFDVYGRLNSACTSSYTNLMMTRVSYACHFAYEFIECCYRIPAIETGSLQTTQRGTRRLLNQQTQVRPLRFPRPRLCHCLWEKAP